MINFKKYQGTGNDFVMIDDRNLTFPESKNVIAELCDRRFGIGADGLILIRNRADYDFEMVYYNADGNPSSMCGNGGRCAVRFAESLGIFTKKTHFLAVDGEHSAEANLEEIYLKMGKVFDIERRPDAERRPYDFMNTGSPHYITYVPDNQAVDVFSEGRKIRFSQEWVKRGGTNINFVQVLDGNTIFVRTYERGVEDETFSCGTGVTAAALSAYLRFGMKSPISIKTKGGNLRVSFDENFENVYLIGAAEMVFEGNFDIK
jgi:diaminopimelate epimerase